MNIAKPEKLPIQRLPSLYFPSLIAKSFQQMQEAAGLERQKQLDVQTSARSWFDPWLNRMARERYAEMYEQSAATEIGGRLLGGAQAAALGGGIGGILGGLIGLLFPTVGEEPFLVAAGAKIGIAATASASTLMASLGLIAGATLTAPIGIATSDYTTFNASMALMNNTILETVRNPGRGLLNTLYTLGVTMDQATGATIIKSGLASAVSGENFWDKLKSSYGATDFGRKEMDFSEIRKGLGIEVGQVGNFTIDMLGEFITDPGIIGAIGAKIAAKSASKVSQEVLENMSQAVGKSTVQRTAKVYTDILDVMDDALSETASLGKPSLKKTLTKMYSGHKVDAMRKRISQAMITGDANDLEKIALNNQKYTPIDDIKEMIFAFHKKAASQTAVRAFDFLKSLDMVDDTITSFIFRFGTAPGLVGTIIQKYSWLDKKYDLLFTRLNNKKLVSSMKQMTSSEYAAKVEHDVKLSHDDLLRQYYKHLEDLEAMEKDVNNINTRKMKILNYKAKRNEYLNKIKEFETDKNSKANYNTRINEKNKELKDLQDEYINHMFSDTESMQKLYAKIQDTEKEIEKIKAMLKDLQDKYDFSNSKTLEDFLKLDLDEPVDVTNSYKVMKDAELEISKLSGKPFDSSLDNAKVLLDKLDALYTKEQLELDNMFKNIEGLNANIDVESKLLTANIHKQKFSQLRILVSNLYKLMELSKSHSNKMLDATLKAELTQNVMSIFSILKSANGSDISMFFADSKFNALFEFINNQMEENILAQLYDQVSKSLPKNQEAFRALSKKEQIVKTGIGTFYNQLVTPKVYYRHFKPGKHMDEMRYLNFSMLDENAGFAYFESFEEIVDAIYQGINGSSEELEKIERLIPIGEEGALLRQAFPKLKNDFVRFVSLYQGYAADTTKFKMLIDRIEDLFYIYRFSTNRKEYKISPKINKMYDQIKRPFSFTNMINWNRADLKDMIRRLDADLRKTDIYSYSQPFREQKIMLRKKLVEQFNILDPKLDNNVPTIYKMFPDFVYSRSINNIEDINEMILKIKTMDSHYNAPNVARITYDQFHGLLETDYYFEKLELLDSKIANEFKGIFADLRKDIFGITDKSRIYKTPEDIKKFFDSIRGEQFKKAINDLKNTPREPSGVLKSMQDYLDGNIKKIIEENNLNEEIIQGFKIHAEDPTKGLDPSKYNMQIQDAYNKIKQAQDLQEQLKAYKTFTVDKEDALIKNIGQVTNNEQATALVYYIEYLFNQGMNKIWDCNPANTGSLRQIFVSENNKLLEPGSRAEDLFKQLDRVVHTLTAVSRKSAFNVSDLMIQETTKLMKSLFAESNLLKNNIDIAKLFNEYMNKIDELLNINNNLYYFQYGYHSDRYISATGKRLLDMGVLSFNHTTRKVQIDNERMESFIQATQEVFKISDVDLKTKVHAAMQAFNSSKGVDFENELGRLFQKLVEHPRKSFDNLTEAQFAQSRFADRAEDNIYDVLKDHKINQTHLLTRRSSKFHKQIPLDQQRRIIYDVETSKMFFGDIIQIHARDNQGNVFEFFLDPDKVGGGLEIDKDAFRVHELDRKALKSKTNKGSAEEMIIAFGKFVNNDGVLIAHNGSYDVKSLINMIAKANNKKLFDDVLQTKETWDEMNIEDYSNLFKDTGLDVDYIDSETFGSSFASLFDLDDTIKTTSNVGMGVRAGTVGRVIENSMGVMFDYNGQPVSDVAKYMKDNKFEKIIFERYDKTGRLRQYLVNVDDLTYKPTHDAAIDTEITMDMVEKLLRNDTLKGKTLDELSDFKKIISVDNIITELEKKVGYEWKTSNAKIVSTLSETLQNLTRRIPTDGEQLSSFKSGDFTNIAVTEHLEEIRLILFGEKSLQDLTYDSGITPVDITKAIRSLSKEDLESLSEEIDELIYALKADVSSTIVDAQIYALKSFNDLSDQIVNTINTRYSKLYVDGGYLHMNTARANLMLNAEMQRNEYFKAFDFIMNDHAYDIDINADDYSAIQYLRDTFQKLIKENTKVNRDIEQMQVILRDIREGMNFYDACIGLLHVGLKDKLYDENNNAFDILSQMLREVNKVLSDKVPEEEEMLRRLNMELSNLAKHYYSKGPGEILPEDSKFGEQLFAEIINRLTLGATKAYQAGKLEMLFAVDTDMSNRIYHEFNTHFRNVMEQIYPSEKNVRFEAARRMNVTEETLNPHKNLRDTGENLFRNFVDSIRQPLKNIRDENRKLRSLGYVRESDIRTLTGKYNREIIAANYNYTFVGMDKYNESQQLKRLMYKILSGITDQTRVLPGQYVEFEKLAMAKVINELSALLNVDRVSLLKRTSDVNMITTYNKYLESLYFEILADPKRFGKYFDVNKLRLIDDEIKALSMSFVTNTEELQRRMRTIVIKNIIDYDGGVVEGGTTISMKGIKDELFKANDQMDDATSILTRAMTNSEAWGLTQNILKGFRDIVTGEYHYQELQSFLKDNPDLKMVIELPKKVVNDATGKTSVGVLRQIDTNNMELFKEILDNQEKYHITFMDGDSFISITNKLEPVHMTKLAEFLHSTILQPLKILSIFNLPFLINNAMEGLIKNSMESGNIPLSTIDMFVAAKKYHTYYKFYSKVTKDIDLINKYKDIKLLDEKWIDELIRNWSKYTGEAKVNMDIIDELREFKKFAKLEASAFELSEFKRDVQIAMIREKFYDDLKAKVNKSGIKNLDDEELDMWYVINREPSAGFDTIENEMAFLEIKIDKGTASKAEFKRFYTLKSDENKLSHWTSKMYNWTLFRTAQASLSVSSTFETIGRYAMYNRTLLNGGAVSEAAEKLKKWYFVYSNKSAAEKYAEFIVPFITYPTRTAELFYGLMQDHTTAKFVTEFSQYSWGDREYADSDYLVNRKMKGDVLLNGTTALGVGLPFYDALRTTGSPLEALNNKLNPLIKPIVDLVNDAEYNRWTGLPLVSQARSFQEVYQRADAGGLQTNAVATLFPSVTNEYFKRQNYNYTASRQYPRYNYKNYYTQGGYSRMQMRMQPGTLQNLPYRVNDIMYLFRQNRGH